MLFKGSKMKQQITLPRATLEQLVAALEEAHDLSLDERAFASRQVMLDAITAGRAAIANAEPKKQYAWECNECGSQEYTMALSESDVHDLGCGKCGSSEWHKAEVKP